MKTIVPYSMRNRFRYQFLVVLSLLSPVLVLPVKASTASDLKLLLTGNRKAATDAANRLANEPTDSLASWIEHFSNYPKHDSTSRFIHLSHQLDNGAVAPAFLYVPTHYNPRIPRPLLLYLHGGVLSKREFPPYTDTVLLTQNEYVAICEQHNWLYLFPEARYDCAWWTPVGMDNIRWMVREAKRKCNIDDDHVNVSGFSDGTSGGYQFAMSIPTDFSQFFLWSGFIAAGSISGIQQNLANMRNRPSYATTGGKDRLYPTANVLPLLQFAQNAGANIQIQSFDTAGHNAGYLKLVYSEFERKVEQNRRKSFNPKLYWECNDLRFNNVDWLTITALDTVQSPAKWYREYDSRSVGNAFPRLVRSGAVQAQFQSNRFTLETSRVKTVTLLLHPKMIQFYQPVVVVINGNTVFNGIVNKDSKFLLDNFLANRDRKQLWQAKLVVDVP